MTSNVAEGGKPTPNLVLLSGPLLLNRRRSDSHRLERSQNLPGRLSNRFCVEMDVHLWCHGLKVRTFTPVELLELTASRLSAQPVGVARLGYPDRAFDVDLNEVRVAIAVLRASTCS